MRDQDNDTKNVPQTSYGTAPERIFNEARNADRLMVIAVKGGKPHLWADGDERSSQELLTQFFPSAVLPEIEQVG
jgi:hypothetical protein